MKPISKLHFITTNAATAELACKGGIDWIQLRLKDVSYEQFREEALKVQQVCKAYSATLIINDNVKLALEIGADGVHIGKEDVMTPEEEAILISRGGIIGCTTNTVEEILHFKGKAISYVGLGPFRFTNTKKNLSPLLGLEGYSQICKALMNENDLPPVIAIGGITIDDVPALFDTGIYGIAVSGAIATADDCVTAADTFRQAVFQNS